MIVFKKLRYKNFLSTGNTFTEYDLNSRNNTLIIGKNGSGKSTLLDALTFSLFGKAYRNINKPSLVNSVNQKDCMVELEFSIGKKEYVIRRGLKPAVLDINVDGVELDKNASVKDFQNNLESNVLKMNYKSFCSVVILGARYDSFMNMSPADRRKVVEDVLDIEIFSEMNVVLKEKLSKLKESMRDNESEIRLNEEKKSLQQSNIETSIKEREEEIDRKQSKISVMQVDVDNDVRTLVDDKINAIRLKKDINTKRPPLEKKKKQVEEIFRDLNKKKGSVEKERKFYTDHDSCPTCMQDIDQHFRENMIEKKVSTLSDVQEGIAQLSDTLTTVNSEIEAVAKMESMLDGFTRSVTTKENRISTETSRIKSLYDEIAELRKKNDSPSDDREKVLKNLEHTIAILDDEKFGLSQKKKSHDIAYDMLKDSGIKAKIIENYLPVINAQINEHLQDLDFYVKFELDETFNETIKSRHLDEFTYASFSEGEKARIDLALLFTWRKIAELKNSVSTNLLILDEVFDGSLDAIGADEVMAKLLFKQSQHFDGKVRDTQSNDTNVFVISHKIDLVDKFTETIKFEKVRGFSKMV
jgi:DNA repair exonuclease SbcCD ATPase subunit